MLKNEHRCTAITALNRSIFVSKTILVGVASFWWEQSSHNNGSHSRNIHQEGGEFSDSLLQGAESNRILGIFACVDVRVAIMIACASLSFAKERSCCYSFAVLLLLAKRGRSCLAKSWRMQMCRAGARRQLTSTQCATSCDVIRYHLTSSRNMRRQRDDVS